jgi:hypothetical protein
MRRQERDGAAGRAARCRSWHLRGFPVGKDGAGLIGFRVVAFDPSLGNAVGPFRTELVREAICGRRAYKSDRREDRFLRIGRHFCSDRQDIEGDIARFLGAGKAAQAARVLDERVVLMRHPRILPPPCSLGLAIATTSAAFLPHCVKRIRGTSASSVIAVLNQPINAVREQICVRAAAGHLCVRVDLKAPRYGESSDYLVIRGY